MASYTATIITPLSVDEAWARMEDVTRFAEWDPGVRAARQVAGDGPGPDAAYVLTVDSIKGALDLRYDVIEFEAPRRLYLVADTGVLRSEDTVTIADTPAGTSLVYHAELTLRGIYAVATPVLAVAFQVIGRRAAAGLRTFLDAA